MNQAHRQGGGAVFTLKGHREITVGSCLLRMGPACQDSCGGFKTGATLQLGTEDREVATGGTWPERAGRAGTKSLWLLTKLCLRCRTGAPHMCFEKGVSNGGFHWPSVSPHGPWSPNPQCRQD